MTSENCEFTGAPSQGPPRTEVGQKNETRLTSRKKGTPEVTGHTERLVDDPIQIESRNGRRISLNLHIPPD